MLSNSVRILYHEYYSCYDRKSYCNEGIVDIFSILTTVDIVAKHNFFVQGQKGGSSIMSMDAREIRRDLVYEYCYKHCD